MSLQSPAESLATHTAAERLVFFYENLTPANLHLIGDCYAPDARFKDPFNEVRGVAAISQIFSHMFVNLDQPRFKVTERLMQGRQAFLAWEFHFRMKRWRSGVDQCIHGGSLLRFDEQGRVDFHRDYWDTAEELYEKLPVLGSLIRWLRKSGSAAT
ncbi:nuclear transport factor 2 family protein [Ottowia caeni]|uniref:nuclear transport factor 2 family protein n=1 Tax=Ottowia caeni TaxID=2870339 RepID=UPI001E295F3A|nr:nuclear transport factor 2 family protein [Ottowia caeni]